MYRILLFLLVLGATNAAKILFFVPTPAYSHQITFQPVWRELSLRGHQVTVVTTNPLKDPTLKNLREIDLSEESYKIWNRHLSALGVAEEVDSTDLESFMKAGKELVRMQLSHPEVQELIKNKKNEKFDVVIVEAAGVHGLHFKDVYQCPLISMSSMPMHMNADELYGNPNHPVTHPDANLPFSRNLTFSERIESVSYNIMLRLMMRQFMDFVDEEHQKAFGKNVRTLGEIINEVSVMFANTNPILNPPKANVPAVIDFSGIHIKPAKPLPADLKTYMDEATEGVIYVSFGSTIKGSIMPKDKLEVFLQTFRELPYKVLWKYDAESLPKNLKNIKLIKWGPQQDILRHPNLKLFVTQGGLQSVDEAMYTKTPLVVLPFCTDQFGNGKKVQDVGIGKTLRFSTLTKDQFKAAIVEVISGDYAKKAEEYYNILIDTPVTALEKVVWWIEYVIRHKGAAHLRSPRLDLPRYQDYLLDVIGFVALSVSIVLYVSYKILKFLFVKIKNIFYKVKVD